MRSSDAGTALLQAIERHGFNEQDVVRQAGVAVLCCSDYEANYSTEAFSGDPGFVTQAQHLGLWCALGDDGHPEWDLHHEVYSPTALVGTWHGTSTSKTVIDEDDFVRLTAQKTDAEAMSAIRQHFAAGNRLLGEWIAEAEAMGA